MKIKASLQRLFLPTVVGLAGLLTGLEVWAQTTPPLTRQWSPDARPISGGITVSAYPIVTGEPFTAENNSRRVEMRNGEKIVYESHSIIARDSAGRVATRTHERHISTPNGGSTGVLGGGSIVDPVAMVHMQWYESGPQPLAETVSKNRILPNTPQSRPQPLNECERESGQMRNSRNGETKQIKDLGERTIQGILTHGCRLTTLIPAGAVHTEPLTITDDSWSSSQFRITLLRIHHDSSGTDEIQQLDNIVRGEPDLSLFNAPQGYKVRDMDAEKEQQERSKVTMEPGGPDAEMLAGAWETDDPFVGKPSQMGILLDIRADRRVPINRGKVTGDGPLKISSIDVRVYQRIAGEDKGGWFSAVPANSNGGASWDGQRLQVNFPGHVGTFTSDALSLDLTFNQKELSWKGSYTRNGVTKQIVLIRPGASLKAVSNPFLGGWSENGEVGESYCVYIAQGSEGKLVSWRDTGFGPIVESNEGMKTETFEEENGDVLGVQINGNTVTLQEGIYWGAVVGQPPQKFTGKLSPDGSQIIGTWESGFHFPEGQRQPPPSKVTTFTRMTGQSCSYQGRN